MATLDRFYCTWISGREDQSLSSWIHKSWTTNANISMLTYHSLQSFPRQEHLIIVNDPVYCLAILEILEIYILYHRQTKPPYFFLKRSIKMYLRYTAFSINRIPIKSCQNFKFSQIENCQNFKFSQSGNNFSISVYYNVFLFDLILYVPVNIFSVILGWVFLGWTSTKQGLMCLTQGHNAVTPVRLEPATPPAQVKHSTTGPLHSK